jgi:hypothetical protein
MAAAAFIQKMTMTKEEADNTIQIVANIKE